MHYNIIGFYALLLFIRIKKVGVWVSLFRTFKTLCGFILYAHDMPKA